MSSDLEQKIIAFGSLSEGWDGEGAAAPSQQSINSALTLVRAALKSGQNLDDLEATLHVDGTVILEAERSFSIRYLKDGSFTVVYS